MDYFSKKEENRRLKKLNKKTRYWGSGAYYDERKKRYIKRSVSRRTSIPKYYRKQANKKVRKYDGAMSYSDYRRVFDYQWTID